LFEASMNTKSTTSSPPGGITGSRSGVSRDVPLQPVIEDTAATARAVSENVKETARNIGSDAARTSAELGADLKQTAQSVQRAAKEQASAFAADVGHELGQTAEEQKVRGVEAMQGFAHAINTAAKELERQSPMVARYARDAAQQVETLSNNLRGRSVTDLMHAASDLARAQPAMFIAGAVASGFMLSRFLKSSASRTGTEASTSAPGRRETPMQAPAAYHQPMPGGVPTPNRS
jgi:hypothetical protein